jgi:hypothetical protein
MINVSQWLKLRRECRLSLRLIGQRGLVNSTLIDCWQKKKKKLWKTTESIVVKELREMCLVGN